MRSQWDMLRGQRRKGAAQSQWVLMRDKRRKALSPSPLVVVQVLPINPHLALRSEIPQEIQDKAKVR